MKGKPKRKSIKAASHSGMGSKRKLSRMGKKRKKDRAGLDATFIGRSACLRRLQVSLKDFRRLCILKGVYPREPRGRAPGNKKSQTYYHIKDVRAIAHEPVLEKFREFRAFMKKVRKAAGRNEKEEASRKYALAPVYTLHHLVRERYPRFSDALNDLDDALTLCNLFAALPSEKDIAAKITRKAKSLSGSWAAYCAVTSSITKSFISVKGVYLEASVHGCVIRWIVPHSFTQNMPDEIDYKVMLTFFEFYETLLSFILFKLYNELGLRYPLPSQTVGGDGTGNTSAVIASNLKAVTTALTASVGGITDIVDASIDKTKSSDTIKASKKSKALIQSVGSALAHVSDDEEDDDDEEDEGVDISGPLRAALDSMAETENQNSMPGAAPVLATLGEDASKRKRLFAGLTFFLSREVPRGYLELVCLAFGGRVGWEGPTSPFDISDSSITHQLVDRPKLPASYETYKSREFVQPQWVLDCANFMFLLPIERYAVGATLPPHLSPWVDDEEEGYKPAYAEEIERLKNGEPYVGTEMKDDDEIENEEDQPTADVEGNTNESSDEESNQLEEEEDDNVKEESELVAKAKAEKESHVLAKGMMSKKATRLYNRMQHGLSAKKTKVEDLKRKRQELEQASKNRDADKPIAKDSQEGVTPLKQKVIRLKKERRKTEKQYSDTGGSMKKSKKR